MLTNIRASTENRRVLKHMRDYAELFMELCKFAEYNTFWQGRKYAELSIAWKTISMWLVKHRVESVIVVCDLL